VFLCPTTASLLRLAHIGYRFIATPIPLFAFAPEFNDTPSICGCSSLSSNCIDRAICETKEQGRKRLWTVRHLLTKKYTDRVWLKIERLAIGLRIGHPTTTSFSPYLTNSADQSGVFPKSTRRIKPTRPLIIFPHTRVAFG
jgi:hypothetical protein